ncbi:MAG: dolichyl-phosphate beta-glucosyltransferase [bacterium]
MTTPKISIIIPAYNEAHRIGKTLGEYLKYYSSVYPDNFEIIVVLNGCKDNTEEIVKEFSNSHQCVKYLVFHEAIGKGGAITKGLEAAKGELVGYTDADNSTRPEVLHRLIAALDLTPEIDCVVGSRWLSDSKVERQPFVRRVMSRVFNLIVNMYFGLGLKDTQCGAKFIRREMIPKILPNLMISDMAFDVNFLVDVKKAGGSILEMPIEWEDDPNSTVNKFQTSVFMFMSVTRLKILYSRFKFIYPILHPLGLFIRNKVFRAKKVK